jgi:CRP-like cAMP-binding protein
MAKSNIIEAREGECLVRKGLGTCNLFLVLDGTARVQLPQGERRDLVRGDVYGELAFFLGSRTADVVVASRSARILCLSDSVVRRLLDGEHRLGTRLAMNLGCVVAARLADDIVKR